MTLTLACRQATAYIMFTMNEKLLSAEIPSPESLFAKLTSLAFDIDPDFRSGESDVMTYTRSSKQFAGQLIDNCDPEQKIPLFNEKILDFKATRTEIDDHTTANKLPVGFTIRQEIVTQIEGDTRASSSPSRR